MERCRKRVDKPSEFLEIFDERVKPPTLPEVPQTEKFPPEKVRSVFNFLNAVILFSLKAIS